MEDQGLLPKLPRDHNNLTSLIKNWLNTSGTGGKSCTAADSENFSKEETDMKEEAKTVVEKDEPEEYRDSDSPSSVMKFFPFGLDQNMVCPMCKKCFRFEKNLLRHMQNSHATGTGESVLKCKLCNYTTRHYSNMYVHIRTHTGDKPYTCSACGAAFTQGSSLKLHIKSRHNDNTEYFSLTRKPGKNNLTKLWTRVLKKDLPKFNSNIFSAIMMTHQDNGLMKNSNFNLSQQTKNRRNINKRHSKLQRKRDILQEMRQNSILEKVPSNEVQRQASVPLPITRLNLNNEQNTSPPHFNEIFNKFNLFTEAASLLMKTTNQQNQHHLISSGSLKVQSENHNAYFYNGYRVPSPTALLNKIRNN